MPAVILSLSKVAVATDEFLNAVTKHSWQHLFRLVGAGVEYEEWPTCPIASEAKNSPHAGIRQKGFLAG